MHPFIIRALSAALAVMCTTIALLVLDTLARPEAALIAAGDVGGSAAGTSRRSG